jgi:hypothetical protein
LQLLAAFLRFGLGNTKVVVVKDTNSLDDERGGDAPILNAQQVLAVARVSWTGKIIEAEINACVRLIEINRREFVMETGAAVASGRRRRFDLRVVRGTANAGRLVSPQAF